nr:hypothetical protein [Tanacetum cinerariifolium]
DGLAMQPVAPLSTDYIPGPKEPQIPPVPQEEDEREPMFIQPHDPDNVPGPIYPEYIPLEDEHMFLAEEQPLPSIPVAPLSTDYIPGPKEPQIPPVPQEEDEREPMFIQPHDPDNVPGPIYPEYIPLEDEHMFLAEEQPLPSIVSPTAESLPTRPI